ncbi:hypothetical protein [Microbispora sp. NPDC049125]|uniref:hypothetical protein n=1 Tax=Microbispora sp. NPDC049125 TaxID=3154929 RepID=UPI0034672B12
MDEGARTSRRTAPVLGFTAVAATAAPLILATAGEAGVARVCFLGTDAVRADRVASLPLFWAELLLPALLAGLLLLAPRRAAVRGGAAIAAILVAAVVDGVVLPGSDPCRGTPLPTSTPWPLMACYLVGAGALIAFHRLGAGSPTGRRPAGLLALTASVAAVWTPLTCLLELDIPSGYAEDTFGWYAGNILIDPSPLERISGSFAAAEMTGVPLAVVALAVAARAAGEGRAARVASACAAIVLLAVALADVAACWGDSSGLAQLVRWPLVLSAVLVVALAWGPPGWAATTGRMRARWNAVPSGARDLTLLLGAVALVAWLVMTYFLPLAP